jgi:hypothetical protein
MTAGRVTSLMASPAALPEIAAELERHGHVTTKGNRYSAGAVWSWRQTETDAATSRKKEFPQAKPPPRGTKTPVLFCEAMALPDHAPVGLMELYIPE